MQPLFTLVLWGCDSDYKLDDSGGDWDEEEPVLSSECYPQTHSRAQNIYDLDTGTPHYDETWETCMTGDAYSSATKGVDTYIISASVYGYDDVIPPGEVHVYMVPTDPDPAVFHSWPGDALYLTPKPAVDVSAGLALDWQTLWHYELDLDADFEAWNDCYPDCQWNFGTEIIDSDVADADECEENYDDNDDYMTSEEGLDVCVTFAYGTYPPPIAPPVGCTAGSGKFQLIPSAWQDWNHDGLRTVQWKPLQETGRAPLTAAANVTSIKLVNAQSVPVKVIQKDQLYNFGNDDKLTMSGHGGNTLLSDKRTKTFSRSQLRGDLHFVSEDVPKGKYPIEATMAWTCPAASTAGTPPVETLPQGYMIGLDELGCEGFKQKIVVRPEFNGEQSGLATAELYGIPQTQVLANLRFMDDRWYFSVHKRGVEIEGSFAVDGDTLDADLDWLTYRGVGLCDVGHYVLKKEE